MIYLGKLALRAGSGKLGNVIALSIPCSRRLNDFGKNFLVESWMEQLDVAKKKKKSRMEKMASRKPCGKLADELFYRAI